MSNKKAHGMWKFLVLSALLVATLAVYVYAIDPTGVSTITYHSNSTKNATTPASRTDQNGYIHTVTLDSTQQNSKWKAYVGNISSTFTLDDSADDTIYQWTIDSFTGQVYITRSNDITWSNIECANVTHKEAEDTALGHNSTAVDSVNITFSAQNHKAIDVGDTSFSAAQCFSTCMWINDAQQTCNAAAKFQEIALYDGNDFVYATTVEDDEPGYKDDANYTYDFMAIIADNATVGTTQQYYFYVELR